MLKRVSSATCSRGSILHRRLPTPPDSALHPQLFCSNCWLDGVCPPNFPEQVSADISTRAGATRRFERGDVVYRKDEVFHSLFVVLTGSFKSIARSYEGYEKITALHLPGEIFGLAALEEGRYTRDAVALQTGAVCAIRYSRLQGALRDNLRLEHELFKVISCGISRHQTLAERIHGLSAEARVALFIVALSERYRRCGHDPSRFPLTLTRVDMANYLGLSHETASRTVSHLCRARLILLDAPMVEILDMGELVRLSEVALTDDCGCHQFGC